MMSLQDWLPTLLAAAGEPEITEKLRDGYQAGGREFKVHLDGYDFGPLLRGEAQKPPREEFFYFNQGGELNAVRVFDWKVHFAVQRGNIATSTREVTGWPMLVNLRADPFEQAPHESGMYFRWYGDNMWIFVPIQMKIKEFFETYNDFPHQSGSSLTAGNISYTSLRAMEALKRLDELNALPPMRN